MESNEERQLCGEASCINPNTNASFLLGEDCTVSFILKYCVNAIPVLLYKSKETPWQMKRAVSLDLVQKFAGKPWRCASLKLHLIVMSIYWISIVKSYFFLRQDFTMQIFEEEKNNWLNQKNSSIGQITSRVFATVQLRWGAISSGGFSQQFQKKVFASIFFFKFWHQFLVYNFNCGRYGPTNMATAFQLLNLFGIFWGIFFVEAFGQVSVWTSSQKLGRHALHRVRLVWKSLG